MCQKRNSKGQKFESYFYILYYYYYFYFVLINWGGNNLNMVKILDSKMEKERSWWESIIWNYKHKMGNFTISRLLKLGEKHVGLLSFYKKLKVKLEGQKWYGRMICSSNYNSFQTCHDSSLTKCLVTFYLFDYFFIQSLIQDFPNSRLIWRMKSSN